MPFLDIEARPVDIQKHFKTLDEFDLIVDATGEEALPLALNDFAVGERPYFPPMVYSWIVGNGGAAHPFERRRDVAGVAGDARVVEQDHLTVPEPPARRG